MIFFVSDYYPVFLLCSNPFFIFWEDSSIQYRFEITSRKSKNDDEPMTYITYRGSAIQHQNDNTHLAHAMNQNLSSVDVIDLDAEEETKITLPIVTVTPSDCFAYVQPMDSRIPFASRISGCGLIDITSLTIRSTKSQDMSLLMEHMKSFINNKNIDLDMDICDPPCDANSPYNVIVNAGFHESCRSLLYFDEPIEKGQTVGIVFQRANDVFRGDKYKEYHFRHRHLIHEALQTLCERDLRVIFRFLQKTICDLEESIIGGPVENAVQSAVSSKRRCSWLGKIIQLEMVNEPSSVETLSFGRHEFRAYVDSPEKKRVAVETLTIELQEEIKAGLELDHLCGINRATWCKLATLTLDAMVDWLYSRYVSFEPETNSSHVAISDKVEELLKLPLTLENCTLGDRLTKNL
jgi:hypothetical protein